MKTICDISLYDLCGNDFEVWMKKSKGFGFDLEVESEEGNKHIELGLHPFAADSLADFCRQYLHCYDKLQKALIE